MKMANVPDNVKAVIKYYSKEVGKYEDDQFNISMYFDYADEIESPIERILYIALKALCIFNFGRTEDCISIIPQKTIGNYRCDFEIIYHMPLEKNDIMKSVLVECDSQQFHERTEQERRYEKARDRFFTSQGYTTLHFTGKEIIDNSEKVAREIIIHLIPERLGDIQINSNIED